MDDGKKGIRTQQSEPNSQDPTVRTQQSSSQCRAAGLPPCNYVNSPFPNKLCTTHGDITSLIF